MTTLYDMKCLFCESDASASLSVEHIIPESLGNVDHMLPRGVVCDRCNNYFARKIEGPLLSSAYLKAARSRMLVPSKRGIVPSMACIIPSARMSAEMRVVDGNIFLGAVSEDEHERLTRSIRQGITRTLYIPLPTEIDQSLMSRFLGKVAIEALAARLMQADGWREELLGQEALVPLRRYVREGNPRQSWEFARRRLYSEDALFIDCASTFEVLHEFDFVFEPPNVLYFVLALFGEEFVIDMGNPAIAGYRSWLQDNHNRSPLTPTDAMTAYQYS